MLERRTFNVLEIRAEEGEDKQLRITGHAAVFNQKSEEMFGLREVVLPGAFKKSIKQDDVRALWNHDVNFVLGRTKSGTLRLKEDEIGLRSDIDLPNTQFARDLHESIRRGDVDQMSFGFYVITDALRKDGGDTVRELVEVQLFDVSPVAFPAYPQTDVAVRELRSFFDAKLRSFEAEEHKNEQKDEEKRSEPAPEIEIPGLISADEFLRRVELRRKFHARYGADQKEKK